MADAVRDYAAGALGRGDIESRFEALERRARRESPQAKIERSADLRYRGQSYELNVPWNPRNPAAPFHREHAKIYGYATPEREVEIVTIRVRARQRLAKPKLTRAAIEKGRAETRRIWIDGAWKRAPVWRRAQLTATRSQGPALVLDYGSTTLVAPGWTYRVDRAGNLVLES